MPVLALQWAEDVAPVAGNIAVVTTQGAGTTYNVVAPHHPTTVPARIHLYHDEVSVMRNDSLIVSGPNPAVNYVQHVPFHKEWDINMHGAKITWYGLGAGAYMTNACALYMVMDSNALNVNAACQASVSFSFFFEDVQD